MVKCTSSRVLNITPIITCETYDFLYLCMSVCWSSALSLRPCFVWRIWKEADKQLRLEIMDGMREVCSVSLASGVFLSSLDEDKHAIESMSTLQPRIHEFVYSAHAVHTKTAAVSGWKVSPKPHVQRRQIKLAWCRILISLAVIGIENYICDKCLEQFVVHMLLPCQYLMMTCCRSHYAG